MPAAGDGMLAGHTTLRLGGPARAFVTATTEDDLIARVRSADAAGEPLLVLGGGSNLVVADEGFPGTVVHVATTGIDRSGPAGLTVAAGQDWDALVAACVDDGLAGLECLSGIPGRAGATPIQNVGAYGQEVAGAITSVRVYDRVGGQVRDLATADCGFGYRSSVFKRSLAPGAVTGRFVVLRVTFTLVADKLSMPVSYPELARMLGLDPGGRAPLAEVRAAVLGLRRGKGMVLDPGDPDTRSVGSFFVNPVLTTGQFAALAAAAGPDVPHYPAGPGELKVPAAWLIERAGFGKGYRHPGGARISAKHTLALVNPGGASTASLLALAAEIRDAVRGRFGVELACEPVLAGTSLPGPATGRGRAAGR
jgi:UDP-N-acetylmuramate dehydrogenase